MKLMTYAELEALLMTEFQKGFEACRESAVKLCREQVTRGPFTGSKSATDCANEIARIPVPRWKAKEETKL